jgi:hypothetical protein
MAHTIVLIHSPLLGPGIWRKLAPLLTERGFTVVVPDLRRALDAKPPFYASLVRSIVEQVPNSSHAMAAVAHSGAGALLPAVATALGGLEAALFVDALLPHPGRSWFDTAPALLAQRLVSLARNGSLPPWNQWWPEGAIEALLDDPEDAAQFTDELQAIPLANFEEQAPEMSIPATVRCSYLQLSDGYSSEAEKAVALGWRLRRLALNHLAMLTDPREVAEEIRHLLER